MAGKLYGELMTQKQMLLIFTLAGVILAVILGVYFYRSNLGPGQDEAAVLLTNFTECIAAEKLDKARTLMTEETRAMLRDPGTELGRKVYQNLRLKTVDKLYSEGNNVYTADVILVTLDTLKVMAKAGLMFGERVAEQGPADDPDQVMADIYAEILNRDDLPLIDSFCVIRLELRNGKLQIIGDKALQQALEGNLENITSGDSAE